MCVYLYLYVYIYIYIHNNKQHITYTHMYIHIYIYTCGQTLMHFVFVFNQSRCGICSLVLCWGVLIVVELVAPDA